MALTAKERKFCEEYVRTGSSADAYLNAGYAVLNPATKMTTKAAEILKRPQIKEYIAELKDARAKRVGITHDMVLKRLWAIASADPNDIVSVRVSNCRYCWGKDFKYQFTDVELEHRYAEAERLGMDEPSEEGGGGFNLSRPPHPDCPSCGGSGKAKLLYQDTTKLSPKARLLYAGAEPTRNGIKIKMHNQLDALVKTADALGMFESETIEKLRQANLKKVEAETREIGKELTPVKVEINVVDASKPERVRDDGNQSDSEHTSE